MRFGSVILPIAALVPFLLVCESVCAADKADTDKMYAEWSAIADDTVAPAVADALGFEANWGKGPVPQEVVYEMPETRPSNSNGVEADNGYFHWTERVRLSQITATQFKMETLSCEYTYIQYDRGASFDTKIVDRSGLILLQKHYGNSVLKTASLGTFTPSGPDDGPSNPPFSSFNLTTLGNDYRSNSVDERIEHACTVGKFGDQDVRVACKYTGFSVDPDTGKVDSLTDHGGDANDYRWNPLFNIYMLSPNIGGECYWDSCEGNAHHVIDFRPAGGDWHSKVISAALSPADRKNALALFASGFDAYKAGDFVGAEALLKKGLALDPANSTAYYTLAECARSFWINDQSDAWKKSLAFFYYRRTVDLAPNSAEGVKAQGRLEGGLL